MSGISAIRVELSGRSYDVMVGQGLIAQVASLAEEALRKPTVPVVADARAWEHHGEALSAGFC